MPNWKSYESSVRLLSAIIAAHPQLKLNYDDVGRFYGDGAKYKSVWDRMKIINKNAEAIAAAVEAGLDPFQVPLVDSMLAVKSKTPDISTRFGGDCTKSAIENRFRRIKVDAKLVNDAVEKGVDPITLPIGLDQVNSGSGISCCFGSDASISAISHAINSQIRPATKMIKDCLAKGGDPKDLTLGSLWGVQKVTPVLKKLKASVASGGPKDLAVDQLWFSEKNDIANRFGSHCTKSGLAAHFTRDIKPNATRLQAAFEQGVDPKEITLFENVRDGKSGKEVARCYGKSVNGKAIRNFYHRTVKNDVKLVLDTLAVGGDPEEVQLSGIVKIAGGKYDSIDRGPTETAKCFGDGLKGHALSMHFTRNIRPASKLILGALTRGEDPARTVPIMLVKYFGSDTTAKGIQIAMSRYYNPYGKTVREFADAGGDPKDLLPFSEVESQARGKGGKKMVKYFGSDVTSNALSIAVRRQFSPMAKRVKDFADSGGDCKDLKLIEDQKNGGKDLAKHFGSDTTAGALQKHYSRYYRDNVKAVRKCVQAGGDPKDLTLNLEASDAKSGKEILKHYDSTMKNATLRMGVQRNVTPYFKPVKDCARS
ncbi:unnamed protein product [Diplocarpon coronariae]